MRQSARWRFSGTVAVTLALAAGCGTDGQDSVSPEEARELAREAWIYGFPMAVNYKTLYEYAVNEDSPDYKGPFNTLGCEARLFTPDDRAVVTPNSDTPYCMGWIDLRAEPVVFSVPAMDEDRYYSVQLIDGYTHNFAYIGSLSTGSEAGSYLLTGPGWEGEVSEDFDDVFPVESDFALAIVRTQLFGEDDLARVGEIQEDYVIQPLSAYQGTAAPPAAPEIDFPTWTEGAELTAQSLEYIDFMLDFVEPSPQDVAVRERLATLGLGAEGRFDLDQLGPSTREAVEAGVQEAREELMAWIELSQSDPLISTKIFGTRDFLIRSAREAFDLDRPDLPRAAAAFNGLYGNSAAEAMYPAYFTDADGRPLDASTYSYLLRFPADGLPPTEAFWSLTMYDGQTQLLIENPLDRYLINSTMLEEMSREADGSLVLVIQRDEPSGDERARWLPAPDGPFYLVLRLYGPEDEALSGEWAPPPLEVTGEVGG
ncbi:MAG: DUF1254 domain-containing protein [marine benthic group bacterium]|nr:DUF1254 domain-containing protein [Gemmatimonadota bacterium]